MLELILFTLLVAYMLLDVNYFVRMFLTCSFGWYFRPRLGALDTNVTYGIALPWDVDTTLDHMNNAKVVREFDFGRMELGVRTGVVGHVVAKGGGFPVNCNFIRYRLPVKPFSVFKVESRMLAWDDKHVYIEQSLITLRDGIVRAVAYPKLATAGWNAEKLVGQFWPGTISPPVPAQFKNMSEIGQIVSDTFGRKKVAEVNLVNGQGKGMTGEGHHGEGWIRDGAGAAVGSG